MTNDKDLDEQVFTLLGVSKKDKKRKRIYAASFRKDVEEAIANIYHGRRDAKTPEEVKESERKARADIDRAIENDLVGEHILRDGRSVILMYTRC